jgi:hypothetical protein
MSAIKKMNPKKIMLTFNHYFIIYQIRKTLNIKAKQLP